MAKVTSTRLPGIMAHLVTPPDFSTSHSPEVGAVTSRPKGGVPVGVRSSLVGQGAGERRTLLGIGTYVIDTPRDQQFPFRQRLRDYQERHRGVTKSQTDYLPVIPFRLNPRTEAARDSSLPGAPQKSDGLISPACSSPTPSHSGSHSIENEARVFRSSDDRLESCDRVSFLENQAQRRHADNDGLQSRESSDESSARTRSRRKGRAHSRQKIRSSELHAIGSSLTQREVCDTSSRTAKPLFPGLSTVASQSRDLTPRRKPSPRTNLSELSWNGCGDNLDFKPDRSFESSGPTSKHFSKQTKTRVLGDLIRARNPPEAGCALKESSELVSAYHKRQRIAQMLTRRGNYFRSRDILARDGSDRDWMDLVNVQVVDPGDYDRYASRRRPGVSHGNGLENVPSGMGCREPVELHLLQAPNSRIRPEVYQRPASQEKVQASLAQISIKSRSSLDLDKAIQSNGLT